MATPSSQVHRLALRIGRVLFRYRDLAFVLVILPLALILKPGPAEGRGWLEPALDVLGIGVVALGLTLRSLVLGLAYMKRSGKGKALYADRLMTEGIFAHLRNPLYLGNILIVAGFVFIHGSIWLFLAGIPLVLLAYLLIIGAEEEFLAEKFGAEYEAYRRRVNRFIPSMSGLGDTIHGLSIDWKRVVRKEYGTLFACITGVMFLLWWEDARAYGWRAETGHLWRAILAWIPVLVVYSAVRVLKKKKLLDDREAADLA